jgi:cephalosporin-C deacetylase-like acetyl esterase
MENKYSSMRSLFRIALGWVTWIALAMCPVASAQSPSSSGAEDFSAASLTGSALHSEPPELVERDQQPDYISEWVTLRWRPGDPIYLYVVRPAKVAKPPVVIYLYDYPAETDIFRDDDWCQRVTAGGYAAVGFVPALNGQRYHNRPMKEWFVSELQEALAMSSHDVQMVMNYLAQRGDVDMSRVGMFGVGVGGTIGVIAASADPRIKAIDLLNPWGDWPVWMAKSAVVPENERPGFIKPEFLKKIAGFDPVFLLPQLKTPRIRLNQLDDDFARTPEEAKKKIEAALPSTAESHRFENSKKFDSTAASGGLVFDWIKQQLKPTAVPMNAERKKRGDAVE